MATTEEGSDFKSDPWKRAGWFVALWLAGVAAVGLVALLIRSLL